MSRKAALYHRIITSLGRQYVSDITACASTYQFQTRTRQPRRHYAWRKRQASHDAATLTERRDTQLEPSSVHDAMTLALLTTIRQQLAAGTQSHNQATTPSSIDDAQLAESDNKDAKEQAWKVGATSQQKESEQDEGVDDLWLSPGSLQEIIEHLPEESSDISQDDLFTYSPAMHVVGPQDKLDEKLNVQGDIPATLSTDSKQSEDRQLGHSVTSLDEMARSEQSIHVDDHKPLQDFNSSPSDVQHTSEAAREETITIHPTTEKRRAVEARWKGEHKTHLDLPPRNFEVRNDLMESTYQAYLKPIPTPDALDVRENHWKTAFRNLTSITSHAASDHTPCQEIVYARQDWSFTWTGNPGETLTQLRESTGSSIHAENPRAGSDELSIHFDRFLLEGTPPQNRAALRYIQEFEMLKLVSTQSTQPPQAFDQQQVVVRPTDRNDSNIRMTSSIDKAQSIDIGSFMLAAKEGVALPPLQLNAAVRLLTSPIPIKTSTTRIGQLWLVNHRPTVMNAIRLLLSDPSNIRSTMSGTLTRAFRYLVRRKYWNSIRAIISAYDEHFAGIRRNSVSALDTNAFNALLRDTTFTNRVHSFDFITKEMKQRGLAADTNTWLHFLTLTKACAPSKTNLIIDCLRKFGMLELPSVKKYMIRAQLAEQLEQELISSMQPDLQLPKSFVQDFVAARVPLYGSKWLDRTETEILLDVLLPRGYWKEALELCELMLQQMHKMTDQLFKRFILGASLATSHAPEYAVELLQRFSSMLYSQRQERTLFKRNAYSKLGNQGRPHHRHLMQLDSASYNMLFAIARSGQSWNLLRTIWHHACCHGMVNITMRSYMVNSLKYYSSLKAEQFWQLDDEQFFEASFAAFALGIGNDALFKRATKKSMQSNEDAAQTDVHRDQAAFDQVVPVNSLAYDAYFALIKDEDNRASFRAWRRTLPGNSMNADKVLNHLRKFKAIIPVMAVPKRPEE